MKIPTAALPHTVTIEPYEGTDGSGRPVFGAPRRVRARVASRRTAVRTAEGVDVIATAVCTMRPGPAVPAESRITNGTQTYTVLDVARSDDTARQAGQILTLDGPR